MKASGIQAAVMGTLVLSVLTMSSKGSADVLHLYLASVW